MNSKVNNTFEKITEKKKTISGKEAQKHVGCKIIQNEREGGGEGSHKFREREGTNRIMGKQTNTNANNNNNCPKPANEASQDL